MTSNAIGTFQFICSYQGEFSYQVQFKDGSTRRLVMRSSRRRYCGESTLSAADFERQVNGKIGLIDLTNFSGDIEALVVEFNRFRYLDYKKQVDEIKANPQRYGNYVADLFPVYLGGSYTAANGWVSLHDYEVIRIKAGIPADSCFSPRANLDAVLIEPLSEAVIDTLCESLRGRLYAEAT